MSSIEVIQLLPVDLLAKRVIVSGSGIVVLLVISVSWAIWQVWLRTNHQKTAEPPMLPYLIPGVGHSIAFLRDANETFLSAKRYFRGSYDPFCIFLGGRKTYVITDPKHIAEACKKTKELSFDAFVDMVMGIVGVSQPARTTMWGGTVGETKKSVPSAIRAWVREDMQRGAVSERLFANFLYELDQCLHPTQAWKLSKQLPVGKEGTHSLVRWTGNIILAGSTNALFGHALLDNAPELNECFQDFNLNAWMLLFHYPKFLSRIAHDGKDGSVNALTTYFGLPVEQRADAAPFLLRSEAEMRAHGVSTRDIACVLFKVFWAINGNSAIDVFWLLGHLLYRPALLEQVRAEVIPAFINGFDQSPDVNILQENCPVINAVFWEVLRVHGGASTFRRVVSDTVIADFKFGAGSDVMIPARELHLDTNHWGPDAEVFDHLKFLKNPKLSSHRGLRPFGGGDTLCPGRFLVRQTALSFAATVLTRYDIEVVGGIGSQKFPDGDTNKPTLGVIPPVPGEDIMITASARA